MDDDLKDLECSEDMSDLQLFRVLEARGDIGDVSVDEGWAILADRYPDDARFLLINIFEEVFEGRYRKSYPLEMLIRKLQRLLKLQSQLNEETMSTFLGFVGAIIQDEMDEEVMGQFEDAVMSQTDMPVIPKKTSEAFKRKLIFISRYTRDVVEDGIKSSLKTGSLSGGKDGSDVDLTFDEWCTKTADQEEIAYSTKQAMKAGDRVSHAKFGVGFVLASSQGRADILFQDGKRRLVCG